MTTPVRHTLAATSAYIQMSLVSPAALPPTAAAASMASSLRTVAAPLGVVNVDSVSGSPVRSNRTLVPASAVVNDIYEDVFRNDQCVLNQSASYEAPLPIELPDLREVWPRPAPRGTIHREIREYLFGPAIVNAMLGKPIPSDTRFISLHEAMTLDEAELFWRVMVIAYRVFPEADAASKISAEQRDLFIDLLFRAQAIYFQALYEKLRRSPKECFAFTYAIPAEAMAAKKALDKIFQRYIDPAPPPMRACITALHQCVNLSNLMVGEHRCLFTLPPNMQSILYPLCPEDARHAIWNTGLEIISLLSGNGCWDKEHQEDLMEALETTQKWQYIEVRDILTKSKDTVSPKSIPADMVSAVRRSAIGRGRGTLQARDSSFHSGDQPPLKVDNDLRKTLGAFTERDLTMLAKELLHLGVRVEELIDENGRTVLHKCRNPKVLRIILEHVRKKSILELSRFLEKRNDKGLTALHFHASKNRLEHVRILLEFGANIDALSHLPRSSEAPAQSASKPAEQPTASAGPSSKKNKERVFVAKPEGRGRTALHIVLNAALMDISFHELARFLISQGASLDQADLYPIIPPNMQQLQNWTEDAVKSIEWLRETQIDCAARILKNYATRNANKKLLASATVFFSATYQDPAKPMQRTLAYMRAVQTLRSQAEAHAQEAAAAVSISLLSDQTPHDEVRLVLLLKKIGLQDPQVRDRLGRTILHQDHTPHNFRIILESLRRANLLHLVLDAIDHEVLTPLHYHVRAGNLQAVELLTEFGADVNIPSRLSRTPLHFAIIASEFDPIYLDIAYCLLCWNANLDLKDRIPATGRLRFDSRNTALEYAKSVPKKEAITDAEHEHKAKLEELIQIMEHISRFRPIAGKVLGPSNRENQGFELSSLLDLLEVPKIQALFPRSPLHVSDTPRSRAFLSSDPVDLSLDDDAEPATARSQRSNASLQGKSAKRLSPLGPLSVFGQMLRRPPSPRPPSARSDAGATARTSAGLHSLAAPSPLPGAVPPRLQSHLPPALHASPKLATATLSLRSPSALPTRPQGPTPSAPRLERASHQERDFTPSPVIVSPSESDSSDVPASLTPRFSTPVLPSLAVPSRPPNPISPAGSIDTQHEAQALAHLLATSDSSKSYNALSPHSEGPPEPAQHLHVSLSVHESVHSGNSTHSQQSANSAQSITLSGVSTPSPAASQSLSISATPPSQIPISPSGVNADLPAQQIPPLGSPRPTSRTGTYTIAEGRERSGSDTASSPSMPLSRTLGLHDNGARRSSQATVLASSPGSSLRVLELGRPVSAARSSPLGSPSAGRASPQVAVFASSPLRPFEERRQAAAAPSPALGAHPSPRQRPLPISDGPVYGPFHPAPAKPSRPVTPAQVIASHSPGAGARAAFVSKPLPSPANPAGLPRALSQTESRKPKRRGCCAKQNKVLPDPDEKGGGPKGPGPGPSLGGAGGIVTP